MIKKVSCVLLALFLLALPLWSAGQKDAASGKPQIVVTSWRTEDLERMNRVNAAYMAKNPDVEIIFRPVTDSEYDANMLAGLQTGTGADIVFLRSFVGKTVYDAGYLTALNDKIPALKSFPTASLSAWGTDDGTLYGVPVAGVTHGVYYNKAIFERFKLSPPKTWTEFLAVAETLKANGIVPLAQGSNDEWTLYECVFSGLGANFYGGEAARQALMAGKAKLTDANFVAAFDAVNQLVPYFPQRHESLDYVSMQQMFGTGQAAMFIGGSWEIGVFMDLGADTIGWFAPPVRNAGDTLSYSFHVDMGAAINKDSKNHAAALAYLTWLSTPEFAQLYMNEVPGFFAYAPGNYTLSNKLAQVMVDAATGADLTIRTVWEKLSDRSPSGNALMGEALPRMVRGQLTPAQAAAFVQDGLATWYPPFRK